MDNDDVLDFSMKSCVKKMEKDQRSEVVSLSSGNGKTDNEQPLPRLETDALKNLSAIQIHFNSATPSFAATTIGSATSPMLVDPTSLMSTTSLALSTLYRRRRRQYSTDEKDFGVGSLNAKKSPNVTSTEKDDAYWERRRKNNQAAKRSRDARKMKEDEIAMRAAFLEQENCKLKAEVAVLKNEMVRLHCLLFNQMQP